MPAAVLDVNVFVSAIIAPLGIPRQLWLAWQADRFSLIASEHIIITTMDRLRLPRIARRYGLTDTDAQVFGATVRAGATMVPVLPADIVHVTGDPEDDTVLATARLAQVEYLVTGDRGLLDLGTYEGIDIVTPRQFLVVLSQ
ncbi:MAG: putative toxin-antitoxin system toxin component, PIN family [Chloroflexi bacterium]|nr:putative toxin-antitoxin system toxin component, PIN family [Chloroflexota bacterium]